MSNYEVYTGSAVEYKNYYFEGDDLGEIVEWYVDNRNNCEKYREVLRRIKKAIKESSSFAFDEIISIIESVDL